ncbi:unnamed protein product [Linum trigynum]|uniref:Gnk2-homologous domain-containing protein n=1 Tax=Linum trigynum TaxID=586398 RepID=A0AAV2GB89_9ROSI
MSSSSSTGKKSNKVMIVMVAVLLVVSLRTQSALGDVSWLCNPDIFQNDDLRIASVDFLLNRLVGDNHPGAGYRHVNILGDRLIIYGYRWVDEGATDCISDAIHVLLGSQFCYQHAGGQAWGDGCLLRYETYPFQV